MDGTQCNGNFEYCLHLNVFYVIFKQKGGGDNNSQICTDIFMDDPEGILRVKVGLCGTFFEILLTSAIICIYRVLPGNEIV